MSLDTCFSLPTLAVQYLPHDLPSKRHETHACRSCFSASSAVGWRQLNNPTSNSPQPAQDLPDAPQATAAAMIQPNGPTVVMDTSMGRITCQFFQKQAPKAVANFIGLAEGTIDWTDPTTKKKHAPQALLRQHDVPPGHS